MINGAHAVIYSTDPDADRAFLRDVLELTSVDVGDGWLIFGGVRLFAGLHVEVGNAVQY